MFSLENYNKPQSKRWKFWSKFLTRTLPVYVAITATIPDATLSADAKIWIAAIISAIVATISGLSEFTTDGQPLTDAEVETIINENIEENEQNKTEETRGDQLLGLDTAGQ